MTTYCDYEACPRPADIKVGIRAVLCAHHYKQELGAQS